MGPFQTTVLAFLMVSAKSAWVLGPMSMPSQPSGISLTGTTWVLASLEKLSAHTVSMGSRNLMPLALAFSMISRDSSSLSSSSRLLPMLPPMALTKV